MNVLSKTNLVKIAAYKAASLLQSRKTSMLLLLSQPRLAGLQQDLDGRALLGQHQRVLQLLPLRLRQACVCPRWWLVLEILAEARPACSQASLQHVEQDREKGGSPDFFCDSQGPAGRVAGNMGK